MKAGLPPAALSLSPGLRNSGISLRACSFRERSRLLTPSGLLLGDDWSTLRATPDPGFLAGDLDEGPAARKSACPPPVVASRRERAVYGDHRRAAGVDGIDDLCVSMPWR